MLFSRNLIRTFLALLALGALPLSAEEQPVPAQGGPAVSITDLKPVKLERDAHSKLLVAQCTVNGVPCNLIVDTAASHTTFDIKFIKKNFPGLPLEDVQIAPGSNVRAAPRLFAMRSFSMGGLHIKNFFGLALDLTPLQKDMQVKIDGILGINYLGFSPSGMLPCSFWNAPASPNTGNRWMWNVILPEFFTSAVPGEETLSRWLLTPALLFPWPRWNSGPQLRTAISSPPRQPTLTDTMGTALL